MQHKIINKVICHCGCGEAVEVEFVGGFAGTTCEVKTCSKAPSYIRSFTIPRSAARMMVLATEVSF